MSARDERVRQARIRDLHACLHPGTAWTDCCKSWCSTYVPLLVDGELGDPLDTIDRLRADLTTARECALLGDLNAIEYGIADYIARWGEHWTGRPYIGEFGPQIAGLPVAMANMAMTVIRKHLGGVAGSSPEPPPARSDERNTEDGYWEQQRYDDALHHALDEWRACAQELNRCLSSTGDGTSQAVKAHEWFARLTRGEGTARSEEPAPESRVCQCGHPDELHEDAYCHGCSRACRGFVPSEGGAR